MIDWKELLKKENLTLEEVHQIPSRCNILNQAFINVYLENNWNTDGLLKDISYSLDDLTNENLWMNPIESLQFDINYKNNLPYFVPHYHSFENGLKFLDSENEIHKFLIKKMTFRQILNFSNKIQLKLSNESETEYIHVNKNNGYVLFKPYPYKHKYSMGHECNYARGVMEAIVRSKDYDSFNLKELFCSAKIENILKYYYKDLNITINNQKGQFSINGRVFAERRILDLNKLMEEAFLPEIKNSKIVYITENIDYKGYRIFNKGEVFNAPYCCYKLELYRKPFHKRFNKMFSSKYTSISYKKLEDQLRIAQQKTHEANQSKYLLEQEILKKDEFLRSTSHELRTPLNGIIGLIDSFILSNSENFNSENLDTLKTASISAWRLSYLINDILDYSRMGENTLYLQKSKVSLVQVTDSVIKNLSPVASVKPVSIETVFPSKLPYVEADENRLHQILFNLIGNALKFTHRGKIVISAKVERNKLIICIKDTGIGIPLDNLETIFNIYNQGSEDVARKYGGTGLGLSVTKQLVELHGGEIWVESRQGKGASFFFTLPTDADISTELYDSGFNNKNDVFSVLPDNENKDFSIWQVPAKEQSMILAIDDEPINLKVIEEYLAVDGYLVNSMISGINLMKKLEKEIIPELIILDIFMPEISGYELCSEIRKKYPSHELPILMLTASGNPEDMVQAFSLGANDYITKPVLRSELSARVKTHIELKKSIERISIANKKLNIIDRLISFGFMASTFILQNKITFEQENIILKKAYDYYGPILNQFSIDADLSKLRSQSERQDYFEKVFDKLHNLELQKKMDLLYKIEEKVQSNSNKEFNQEEIEEVADNVFDLVAGLLLVEKPLKDSCQIDHSEFGRENNLTAKEIETVSLIYEGYSNQEIADLMGIALNTVKQHVFHIFNKVGVENRTHLIYKLVDKNNL